MAPSKRNVSPNRVTIRPGFPGHVLFFGPARPEADSEMALQKLSVRRKREAGVGAPSEVHRHSPFLGGLG